MSSPDDSDSVGGDPTGAPARPPSFRGEITFRAVDFRPAPGGSDERPIYAGPTGAPLEPAEAALEYYRSRGYRGVWAGTALWRMVQALLFWDILFPHLGGLAGGRLRDVPPDLRDDDEELASADPKTRRVGLIGKRIEALRSKDSLVEVIRHSYRRHCGKKCTEYIRHWEDYPVDTLTAVVGSLRPASVAAIVERLIRNPQTAQRGMPVLFFFDPRTCLVEVKDERHVLTDDQLAWHRFLADEAGVAVELLLINHSQRRIASVRRKISGRAGELALVLPEREAEAHKRLLGSVQSLPHPPTPEREGPGLIRFRVPLADVETTTGLLDATADWTGRTLAVGGDAVEAAALTNALRCFRKRVERSESESWCRAKEWDDKQENPFGCRWVGLTEFDEGRWTRFGYVNRNAGRWIFNKLSIREEIERQVAEYALCPRVDEDRVLIRLDRLLAEFPDAIDPTSDPEWAFLDDAQTIWIYENGAWTQGWGRKAWPGFAHVVGVKRLSADERLKVLGLGGPSTAGDKDKEAAPPSRWKAPAGCVTLLLAAAVALAAVALYILA